MQPASIPSPPVFIIFQSCSTSLHWLFSIPSPPPPPPVSRLWGNIPNLTTASLESLLIEVQYVKGVACNTKPTENYPPIPCSSPQLYGALECLFGFVILARHFTFFVSVPLLPSTLFRAAGSCFQQQKKPHKKNTVHYLPSTNRHTDKVRD